MYSSRSTAMKVQIDHEGESEQAIEERRKHVISLHSIQPMKFAAELQYSYGLPIIRRK